jgi:hypothetical protein
VQPIVHDELEGRSEQLAMSAALPYSTGGALPHEFGVQLGIAYPNACPYGAHCPSSAQMYEPELLKPSTHRKAHISSKPRSLQIVWLSDPSTDGSLVGQMISSHTGCSSDTGSQTPNPAQTKLLVKTEPMGHVTSLQMKPYG